MSIKKVAIVHDWLVNYGGAERVVEAFLSIYPDADIFTLVYDEKKNGEDFSKGKSTCIIHPKMASINKTIHEIPQIHAESL